MNNATTAIVLHNPHIKSIYDRINQAYLTNNPDIKPDPVGGCRKTLDDTNTVFDLISNSIEYDNEQMVSLYNHYGIDYLDSDTVESIINDYVNFLDTLDTMANVGREPSSHILQSKILAETGLIYLRLGEVLSPYSEVKIVG